MKFEPGKVYRFDSGTYWYCMGEFCYLLKNYLDKSGVIEFTDFLEESGSFTCKEVEFDITPCIKDIKKWKSQRL